MAALCQRRPARGSVRLLCCIVLGLAIGCESSHDDPPAGDVSGTWRTTTWISAYVPGNNVSVTWSLAQLGSAIAGSFADNLNGKGAVAGSVGGSKVFLTFTYSNSTDTVDYEAAVSTNVMSGVFRGAGEVKIGNAQRVLGAQ